MTLHRTTHENMLINILRDIYTEPSIAPYLGFKGGTAAMVFYGLPRFSIDLDFDLLDSSQEELTFNKIQEILGKYGAIKKADKKRYSLFFLLSYHGKTDGAYNVKVDVSRRNFKADYQVLTHLGISMLVMVQADMAANKLVAMHNRLGDSNRDIFDVWYFFDKHWPVNKSLVEERTNVPYTAFLQMCIDALEKFDNHGILSGLGQLLTEKQKVWVKAKLQEETLFLLRLALHTEQRQKELESLAQA